MYIVMYFQVRKGVDENQYVLTWLPGIGNVLMLDPKPTRRKVNLQFVSSL